MNHSIELIQELLKKLFHYDPETGVFTRIAKFDNKNPDKIISVKPYTITSKNVEGYLRLTIKRKTYSQHRMAFLYMYGYIPSDEIEHINQNREDNRISNLRIVKPSVNNNIGIPLTQEILKQLLHYDENTGIFTWIAKTHVKSKKCKIGNQLTNINNVGYLTAQIDKKIYKAHRLAFLYVYGYMPKIVDHINGNTLDNRICNLRATDDLGNARNTKTPNTNTSGIKGVSFCKTHKKWRATIRHNNKQLSLGYFNNIEDAAEIVRITREKLHGEFACHGDREKT